LPRPRSPGLRRAAAQGSATPAASQTGDLAGDIVALVQEEMTEQDLRAVILRVTVAGEEVVTTALGESMIGVPATPQMHFRNGAVSFTYLATMLLQLVDQGVVTLDDPLANWLPDLPESERVTLHMLANMTSGYADHVQDQDFLTAVNTDPFRQWTPQELIEFSISKPHVFEPGTNWDYSHTGYVILGQAIEKITGSRWTP
jgi:CubicO group peptidase (beta-lactamase class C family)